eukprot:6208512-Pleurochrysis_carterae.AAC.1
MVLRLSSLPCRMCRARLPAYCATLVCCAVLCAHLCCAINCAVRLCVLRVHLCFALACGVQCGVVLRARTPAPPSRRPRRRRRPNAERPPNRPAISVSSRCISHVK